MTSNDGRWILIPDGPINVKQFGARGANTVDDDSDKIQNALDIGGQIYFPAGTYRIEETLTITNSNVSLIGEDRNKSRLQFVMTDATSCLKIGTSTANISEVHVSKLRFDGVSDATGAAIELVSLDHCSFKDLTIENLDQASTSRGFWIKGHNIVSFEDIRMTTVRIGFESGENPVSGQSSIDSDQYAFRNIYINCEDDLNGYGWRFTGTHNYSITIDGYSSVGNSLYGFWLENSSVSGDSSGLHIYNLRVEQGTIGNGGYGIYINQDSGADLQNVLLENVRISSGQHGFYGRNIRYLTMINCQTSAGSGEIARNFDNSVKRLVFLNFNASTSATHTMTSLKSIELFGGADYQFEIWDSTQPFFSSSSDKTIQFRRLISQTNYDGGAAPESNEMINWTNTETIANNSTLTHTPPPNIAGMGKIIAINNSGNVAESADFTFNSNGSVNLTSNTTNVSTTQGTANNLNLYGSSNILRVENKLGATHRVTIKIDYSLATTDI